MYCIHNRISGRQLYTSVYTLRKYAFTYTETDVYAVVMFYCLITVKCVRNDVIKQVDLNMSVDLI